MDKIKHSIDEYGNECWKLNGEFHRDDGPAIIFSNGDQFWFQHGKRHREDGPAIMFVTDRRCSWYLNDIGYYFDHYCNILNLSSETILELQLKYM